MNLTEKIKITNEDNMQLMARYPDNYFELAIVDPPYGIDGGTDGRKSNNPTYKKNSFRKYAKNGGINWDKHPPTKDYFNELKRVSKNQIIWGGNHLCEFIGKTKHVIIWDKMNYLPTMSQFELAFSTLNKHPEIFKFTSNQNNRFHISQKPVKLYEWLLMNYAKEGDKILDTHLGSGSIAIACHNLGFELTACELNKDYFDSAIKRIQNHISQQRLF